MEEKVRRGKHAILEKQEKMTFNELMDVYEKQGDDKKYIMQFSDATAPISALASSHRLPVRICLPSGTR